jgi:hypothetical protein
MVDMALPMWTFETANLTVKVASTFRPFEDDIGLVFTTF